MTNLNSKIESTNYTFKILYALSIISIVAVHCSATHLIPFHDFFPTYICHLSIFMFASGYFYKENSILTPSKFILNKTKKLILPLYLWNIFYAILTHFLKHFGFFTDKHVTLKTLLITPIENGHQFALNIGGWFIIPLFSIHLLNLLIRKICYIKNIKINEILFFSICLFLGIIGILLSNEINKDGFFLNIIRILYFLPFYSLGILYKKYEKMFHINTLIYFSVLLTISLLYIYKYGYIPGFTPSWGIFGSNPLKPFILSFLGIAFWFKIAQIITPAIGKNKYVNLIANNTYSIMINHMLGFMLLKFFFMCLYKFNICCESFNMELFKTNPYWCYTPHNSKQMLILYIIVGIIFSIKLQTTIDKMIPKIKKLLKGD